VVGGVKTRGYVGSTGEMRGLLIRKTTKEQSGKGRGPGTPGGRHHLKYRFQDSTLVGCIAACQFRSRTGQRSKRVGGLAFRKGPDGGRTKKLDWGWKARKTGVPSAGGKLDQ